MKRRDEKHPSSEGKWSESGEPAGEFELGSATRLADVEREAIQHGIDAAKLGSFAPQDEMDEFYRLHREA